MEALAVVAEEFGRDDVRRSVPRHVGGGQVQLPQQFSFISAGNLALVVVFAAEL